MPHDDQPAEDAIRIVSVAAFAAVEEPGAKPLVGSDGDAVIPEGGDVMVYGDGGASKTTLAIDLAFHLGAGDDWLGIEISEQVNVLVVEAEGPRPLFRQKLRGKLAGWEGSDVGDRVRVWETPWARFRFPDADEIAERLGEEKVDVLIVGPLSRVGWDDLGTLQEVRQFMDVVADFRERTGRRLTIVLIHHENKGGKVSGAFEGAGDTLLHAEVRSHGVTHLTFQKARWSSEWHKQTLKLEWTDGEGFEPIEEEERDLLAEISEWLTARPEHRHSTVKEIANRKEMDSPGGDVKVFEGIGAREDEVRAVLVDHQNVFHQRTGEEAKAVGRSASAKVWDLKSGNEEEEDDQSDHSLFDA